MRKSIIAGLALWAAFAAFAGKAHAEVNYPWCIIGDTRAIDCYFSTREQCMQDGRNRGFGSQCIQNPYYKPGSPTVSGEKRTLSQSTRPPFPPPCSGSMVPTTVYVGGEVSSKVCRGTAGVEANPCGRMASCMPPSQTPLSLDAI
jgi:hypothetical protein